MENIKYENTLSETILSSVKNSILNYCNESQLDYILNKISKNKDFFKSIILLPYWFYECLNKKDKDIQDQLFILSRAHIQGVMAYTLYDYIRDNKIEKNNINLCLSIANILMNKSMKSFHSLCDKDLNKIQIIDNIINDMNLYYLENNTIKNTHYHFKYLCDNNYRKSYGLSINCLIVLWLTGIKDDIAQSEILNFFKNYLNARQLSDDKDDMCDDLLNNIYTPTTFLMKAKYSSDYIHNMTRSRIDYYMKSCLKHLKNINFNYEKFKELYIKEC